MLVLLLQYTPTCWKVGRLAKSCCPLKLQVPHGEDEPTIPAIFSFPDNLGPEAGNLVNLLE